MRRIFRPPVQLPTPAQQFVWALHPRPSPPAKQDWVGASVTGALVRGMGAADGTLAGTGALLGALDGLDDGSDDGGETP